LLRLLHLARRLPLEREEKRVNENREENNRDAVTAGESLDRIDRIKNRTGEPAPEPRENAVVDRFAQIDLRAAGFGDLFAGVVEQIVILRTDIQFDFGAVRANR